jgi:hypothetical protein
MADTARQLTIPTLTIPQDGAHTQHAREDGAHTAATLQRWSPIPRNQSRPPTAAVGTIPTHLSGSGGVARNIEGGGGPDPLVRQDFLKNGAEIFGPARGVGRRPGCGRGEKCWISTFLGAAPGSVDWCAAPWPAPQKQAPRPGLLSGIGY